MSRRVTRGASVGSSAGGRSNYVANVDGDFSWQNNLSMRMSTRQGRRLHDHQGGALIEGLRQYDQFDASTPVAQVLRRLLPVSRRLRDDEPQKLGLLPISHAAQSITAQTADRDKALIYGAVSRSAMDTASTSALANDRPGARPRRAEQPGRRQQRAPRCAQPTASSKASSPPRAASLPLLPCLPSSFGHCPRAISALRPL